MAAAQNTISILESIKKKMQKFDEKSSGAASAAASLQNQAVAPSSTQASQPVAQAPNNNASSKAADDFHDEFGDLDLDDENSFAQNSGVAASAPSQPVAKVAPAMQAAPQVAADQKHDDLDLDLQDHHLEDSHDNLVLEDDHQEHADLNIDDLDFSDLEDDANLKHDSVAKPEEKKSLSIDDLDNLSLEELESMDSPKPAAAKQGLVAAIKQEQKASQVAPKAPEPQKVSESQKSEEDLFEDEFEKELMDFKPQEKPAPRIPEKITQAVEQKSVAMPVFPPKIEPISQPKEQVKQVVMPVYEKPQPLPPLNQNISYMNEVAKPSMLSQDTIRQASDSVKKLVDAKNMVAGIKSFSQSPALAEVAIQLLEPKLEKWLNENLTHIVENIVREEIKNIIPKD